MNSIRVIHPYWYFGSLVFDDDSVGLVREPFVAGADEVLKILAGQVGEACRQKFTLLFSDSPFPGHQAEMRRAEPEQGGNWYVCEKVGLRGWLCPALYKYFDVAPESLFIQIKEPQA